LINGLRQRRTVVAYVIAAPCVADYSCVEVCPVDCIHPTPDEPGFDTAEQLYIDPQECIDCEACVEACPVEAIFEATRVPERWAHYGQVNAGFFASDAG
jgi:ferredoxin